MTFCAAKTNVPESRDGAAAVIQLVKMITCHCNIITEAEIEQTIIDLLDQDRWQLIVPAKVYHTLSQRGKCCRCFPNVVDIIIRTSDAYHARVATPDADRVTYREKLLQLRSEYTGEPLDLPAVTVRAA